MNILDVLMIFSLTIFFIRSSTYRMPFTSCSPLMSSPCYFLSPSNRLVNRCLCSFYRECLGYTTVTGLILFRRPQWRLASKYSQMWVRDQTNFVFLLLRLKIFHHNLLQMFVWDGNIFILTSQPRAEPLPSRWTWTVRSTTCLSSPIMLCRRASWTGDYQLRTLPDETLAWLSAKITETSLRGYR